MNVKTYRVFNNPLSPKGYRDIEAETPEEAAKIFEQKTGKKARTVDVLEENIWNARVYSVM